MNLYAYGHHSDCGDQANVPHESEKSNEVTPHWHTYLNCLFSRCFMYSVTSSPAVLATFAASLSSCSDLPTNVSSRCMGIGPMPRRPLVSVAADETTNPVSFPSSAFFSSSNGVPSKIAPATLCWMCLRFSPLHMPYICVCMRILANALTASSCAMRS